MSVILPPLTVTRTWAAPYWVSTAVPVAVRAPLGEVAVFAGVAVAVVGRGRLDRGRVRVEGHDAGGADDGGGEDDRGAAHQNANASKWIRGSGTPACRSSPASRCASGSGPHR